MQGGGQEGSRRDREGSSLHRHTPKDLLSCMSYPLGPLPPLQERIRSLIDDRKFLVDDNWAPGDIKGVARRRATDDPEASAMVEKERARLEVLKRRQEKDMQQVWKKCGGRGGGKEGGERGEAGFSWSSTR